MSFFIFMSQNFDFYFIRNPKIYHHGGRVPPGAKIFGSFFSPIYASKIARGFFLISKNFQKLSPPNVQL